ncbi:MAG: hypothetical protein IKN55_11840 [Oscillospiraceae bacterium]|nr:hypothetical protein [Oscillospiraceae bacterium]
MNHKRLICAVLSVAMLLSAGCSKGNEKTNDSEAESYDVVSAEIGETASYGGMTFTVDFAEDPGIKLESGMNAMFFHVTIVNDTDETVTASYLNNFCMTVNGTFYEAYQCCTIPAMRALYDYYDVQAINTEVEPHASCEGYVACEVPPRYDLIELYYIPKTTDRASRISVTLTEDNIRKTAK